MRLLDTKHQRAALLISLLGLALVIALLPFATGLIGIPVLYVIFAPVYKVLAPKIRPQGAAVVTVALALGVLLVLAVILTLVVVNQAPDIARGISQSPLVAKVSNISVGGYRLNPKLASMSEGIIGWLGNSAIGLIGTATRLSLNLTISLFGLFYLLLRGDETWNVVGPYIPFSTENSELLAVRFRLVTTSTVIGTGLTALVQGIMVGVAFAVVGLSHAMFWGVVTVILSILPVVGSGLVWLPGVLVLVLQENYVRAIGLALWGVIVVANVDNVIRPMVFRRYAQIHPLVTLVGAFAGIRYFGLLGLLVGPLALSYFFELIRMYREEYLRPRTRPPVDRRSA
ncbi:MAG: AI-2E family transporter [Gemmatimonadota bacterium]